MQCCLNTLDHIAQLKPYAMLPERLQKTLHKKNVLFNQKAYPSFNNLDITLFLYYPYLIIANLFTKHLPTLVSEKYYTIKKLTSKLQQAATNTGFINKAIHNQVIPKFAEVKGQFLKNNDKHDSKMKILHSHLLENKRGFNIKATGM